MERLREMAENGLSPTALARYIEDPLEFYRKNVLGIPDSEELEETVAANTFGTVLHQALEDLYAPLVGQDLNANNLGKAKKEAPALVQKNLALTLSQKGSDVAPQRERGFCYQRFLLGSR